MMNAHGRTGSDGLFNILLTPSCTNINRLWPELCIYFWREHKMIVKI